MFFSQAFIEAMSNADNARFRRSIANTVRVIREADGTSSLVLI